MTHLESAGWLINAAALRVNRIMKERLTSLNLTQGQFAILKTLAETDNITPTEIGKCVDLQGYAMTRNLDVLEERGLLRRHPDEQSRRSLRIRLTDAGRLLTPELFNITHDVNTEFLETLASHEIDQLNVLLLKLVKRQYSN